MNSDNHTQQFLEILHKFALDKNVDPDAILQNILRDTSQPAETKPTSAEEPTEAPSMVHKRETLLLMRTERGDPPDALVTFKLAPRETSASAIRANMRAKEKKPKRPSTHEVPEWHRSEPSDNPVAPAPVVVEGAPGLDPIRPAPGFVGDPPYDAPMQPDPIVGAVTGDHRFSDLGGAPAVPEPSSAPIEVEEAHAAHGGDHGSAYQYCDDGHWAMQDDTSHEERPPEAVTICAFTMRDIERAADAHLTSCLGYMELSVGDRVRKDYWSGDGWDYGARGEECGWFPSYCTDANAVRPWELADVPVILDPPKVPPPPQPVRHPKPAHPVDGWSDWSTHNADAILPDSPSHPASPSRPNGWFADAPSSPAWPAENSGGWTTIGHCPPAIPPPANPTESARPVMMKAPPRAFPSPVARLWQPHEAASWQDGWQTSTQYGERADKESVVPPNAPPPPGPTPAIVAWLATPDVAPTPNWDSWESTDSWAVGSQQHAAAAASTATPTVRYQTAPIPPAASLADIMETERRAKEEKEAAVVKARQEADAEERRVARGQEEIYAAQWSEQTQSLRAIIEQEEDAKPKPKKAKAPKVPKKNKAAEARRKAEAEAEAFLKVKQEADGKAKLVAEAREKAEAEQKAKAEAIAAAKAAAEEKAKAEAEQKAHAEAEAKAKAEVAQKARAEAEQKAEAKKRKKAAKGGVKADTERNDGKNEPKSKAKAAKEQAPQSVQAKIKTGPGFAFNKFTPFMTDSDADSDNNERANKLPFAPGFHQDNGLQNAKDAKDGGKKKRTKAKEMTALLEMDKLAASKPAPPVVEVEPVWEPWLPRGKKDQQKPKQDPLPQRNAAPPRSKMLMSHGLPTPSSNSASASSFLQRTMPAVTRVIHDTEEKLDPESARYIYRRTDAAQAQEIKTFWGDPRNGLPQHPGRPTLQSTAMASRGAPSATSTWPSQFPVFDPASVSELVSMGFEKEKAAHALAHMNGNLSSAVEWLLSEAACK
eukprot:GEMP01005596.1.p1 GENE.GEMP01005596.1~~GEMP01005596.1.p1  ORF type:complete len:992 (+),score=302.69 GEMP01005596.1:49-3024(+)